MARQRNHGVLAMIAEAQRQQAREQEARHRAAAAAQRQYERAQREAQRAAAQGERAALRAYQQGREADAARRTAELEEQVHRLRTVLATGLAGRPFRLADAPAAFQPPPFDPGPLGRPVEMPDQNRYLVPAPTGLQALNPVARQQYEQQAAQARAAFEQDWYGARQAEDERLRRLADYRAQFDTWVAQNQRLAADRAGQAARLTADLANGAPDAVVELFETVLRARNDWPEDFPCDGSVGWDASTRQLVVDWELPGQDCVPAVARVRYVKSDDREAEVNRPAGERKALYREVLAQCALRVLAELFRADRGGLLASVVLNGYVEGTDPASGRDEQRYLLAVTVRQEDFRAVALDRVAPVDCLVDGLRGRLSARPEKLEPVPTTRLAGEIAEYREAGEDEPDLFEMDPIAFEHLIAELFRRRGFRTRTTARSGDQGVDVIAEDPDPVTGGQIVIQAKRYRRTVDPTAVRDLDATRVHHGATKGILVTTAGFGPDSRRWVEGKPLTLVDGPMLVGLLREHGLSGRLGSGGGGGIPARPTQPPAPVGAVGAAEPTVLLPREDLGLSAPTGQEPTVLLPREDLRPEPVELLPGQNTRLSEAQAAELSVCFESAGPETDLTLLLLTADGTVRSDADFVFYHQPDAADGAVRLAPREHAGEQHSETATVRLPGLPAAVERVAVSVNMDADGSATCGELRSARLSVRAADGTAWDFRPPADPEVSAMLVAELYRHQGGWKLRAMGQGWADGLAGLARAHGVDVG
ncbi:restriction endonuclease [Kitasatospora sp. NPDC002040]|uniref:restriction endonuclease n=1 Tax=Kitasatospora sp. NPDC002040 TaxID=3154661 RepID=UPI00332764B4